jgi:hypothetical protein
MVLLVGHASVADKKGEGNASIGHLKPGVTQKATAWFRPTGRPVMNVH